MMQCRTASLQGLDSISIMPDMKLSGARTKWREDTNRTDFDPSAPGGLRACDHPGCTLGGEHRAPRSRDRLNEYFWFCLDHVRAYNSQWNYYEGMSPDEIEREIRQDTTWQRPTWPMGSGGSAKSAFVNGIHDPYGVMGDTVEAGANGNPLRQRPAKERAAMRRLGLDEPLTLITLKTKYKELVKIHHPDANGGDLQSEETFKDINAAYRVLLTALDATPKQ